MAWLPEITADPDPMRLVREAQERGEEVRLISGYDELGGVVVVGWFIPSSGHIVIEGTAQTPGEALTNE